MILLNEFRVKGLSCGNCAMDLERQIRKLPHGEGATLHYSSARLVVDERIEMDRVRKILKSDGAIIQAALNGPGSAAALKAPFPMAEQANSCSSSDCGCSTDGDKHNHSHDHNHDHSHDHASHNHSHGDSQHEHSHGDHSHAHSHAGHGHDHAHGDDDHHGHDHSHSVGKGIYIELGISFALFLVALVAENSFPYSIIVILYLAAIGLSGWRTFWKGLRNLVQLRFTMDTLMTVALIGAVAIQEWKEAALVAILFGINELLEGLGMNRARQSMEKLLNAAPKEAILLENGQKRSIAVSDLIEGHTVLVSAGAQIPSDGTILTGNSSVNEAAITGESIPVDKQAGDTVFGGSLNQEGSLTIRIDKAFKQSSLAKILQLVQEAQESKTPTELFINRFSRYYTPAIMIIAALVMLIPPLFFGGEWRHWLYEGLAVLIVGCPCALILSSPVAILAGITKLAREGILVKGGAFLEQLGRIKIIAFDKTGTLTKGKPHVAAVQSWDDRFLPVTASMESGSSHPLATAIMSYMKEQRVEHETIETQTALGRGLTATIDGKSYVLGSPQLLDQLELSNAPEAKEKIESYREQGLTLVLLADESKVLGIFGLSDELRPETPEVVKELHRAGISRTVMLTGDHAISAKRMAEASGVRDYEASLLPEDKVDRIKELRKAGRVAMIGDGINDAPALATADLGIAMGKGTDSAIETADLVLMQDHLGKLPSAIRTAKLTNRIIAFNISISLGLKIIALLMTIPGWLTLWIAILSDMGATILVSLVSMILLLPSRKASSSTTSQAS
ncbi:heavy metal translocating P-type ATPase [Paenibacillus herberti]|uniref:heavy metal translocating P-type ATPase n=1 Tax=Paenibacillus herberti TaxID=1619309 RepID=UPI001595429C|nr:heavy metal translocating P-type ATPase [Paenibacillus herberti]